MDVPHTGNHFAENAHQDILKMQPPPSPPIPYLLIFGQKWEINLIKAQASQD